LDLEDTDEICFFDFACSTFNFKDIPELEPYWPNLLSYQDNDDGSATLIYGTIPKDRCDEMTTAERVGENGVSFDDTQKSVLSLGSQLDSLSQSSQTSLAASKTPLLHVRVPKEAKPTINFGQVVFEADRASGGVASAGRHGGKRKHTKRKRNLKKSYRKRRVVTRRRRYSKMNR
jgi:hypothetical protein